MIVALVILCNVTDAIGKEAEQKLSSDEAQQSKYLPLSVGNNWTYRKKVPEGAKVFFIKPYPHGENEAILKGPSEILSGESQETFVVKDHRTEDGIERWEITITPKTARDGRYGTGPFKNADTVLWGRVISSGSVIEIGEIFIYNSSILEPKERRHTLPLFVEPLLENADVTIFGNAPGEYGSSHKRVTVEVPAGRFEGCLEMVQKVKGTDEYKMWTIHSYFASGVGLVKEIQKDEKGNTTYTLELLKYELH